MKIVGLTGTREGMTEAQRDEVADLLAGANEAHHGDCVGADEEFHEICWIYGIPVVIHPPEDDKLRAYCKKGVIRIEPKKPYLQRNKDIVRSSTLMIGAPKEEQEPAPARGQGTWSAIRFARKNSSTLVVVYPSGRTST